MLRHEMPSLTVSTCSLIRMVDTVNGRPAGAPTTGPTDELSPLGERLVNAALDALVETPSDTLSLRLIAKRLDVSHQAPYVHFGSKRRFLAAVAGVGLYQAYEEAEHAVAAAGTVPLDRLQALARSYLSFIRSRPHIHDLAYGPVVAKRDHPLLQAAAIAYWTLLHDIVQACQPPRTGEEEVLRRCATVWGVVYGITRLSAFEQLPEAVPHDIDGLVANALDVLVSGWHAQAARP
jgi:AcrR family transcriptional regulator